MPAMHYTVRWPDAQENVCYSPSLVIQDLLVVGQEYPVAEFMGLVRQATAIANERVQAKFGFVCSRANDQLAKLEHEHRRYAADTSARVRVMAFGPAD
jgi:uncharacterized repeat protein (TIGR04042 family)